MRKTIKFGYIISAAVGLGLLVATDAGCVHYSHVSATGDRTSFNAFLVKGDASKVSSQTAEVCGSTNYYRSVGVGSLKGESDVDKLSVLAEAVARGIVTGANPAKPVK